MPIADKLTANQSVTPQSREDCISKRDRYFSSKYFYSHFPRRISKFKYFHLAFKVFAVIKFLFCKAERFIASGVATKIAEHNLIPAYRRNKNIYPSFII